MQRFTTPFRMTRPPSRLVRGVVCLALLAGLLVAPLSARCECCLPAEVVVAKAACCTTTAPAVDTDVGCCTESGDAMPLLPVASHGATVGTCPCFDAPSQAPHAEEVTPTRHRDGGARLASVLAATTLDPSTGLLAAAPARLSYGGALSAYRPPTHLSLCVIRT